MIDSNTINTVGVLAKGSEERFLKYIAEHPELINKKFKQVSGHTIPRVFVVGTLLRKPKQESIIQEVLTVEALKEGAVGFVFTVQ